MALTRMRPINDVALATDRPHRTIRRWVRLGQVPSSRTPQGRILVDLVAAYALSEQTPRRNHAKAAA